MLLEGPNVGVRILASGDVDEGESDGRGYSSRFADGADDFVEMLTKASPTEGAIPRASLMAQMISYFWRVLT